MTEKKKVCIEEETYKAMKKIVDAYEDTGAVTEENIGEVTETESEEENPTIIPTSIVVEEPEDEE